jgi:transposase
MTRPIGTAAELERRRRRAVELLETGESPPTIARILGVHETSVHRWRRLARSLAGLDAKPHPGPTPRLSDEQLAHLEQLLLQGAKQHGWPNQLWTADRVTVIIDRHFGLKYHPEHVRKILKQRLNWTSQKPQLQAKEQNGGVSATRRLCGVFNGGNAILLGSSHLDLTISLQCPFVDL